MSGKPSTELNDRTLFCARQVAVAARHVGTMVRAVFVAAAKDPLPLADSAELTRCVDALSDFQQIIEAADFQIPFANSCLSQLKWVRESLLKWEKDRRPIESIRRERA